MFNVHTCDCDVGGMQEILEDIVDDDGTWAQGISAGGILSELYSSTDPLPLLLELVTTASNRLSSRSMADWFGLKIWSSGVDTVDAPRNVECLMEVRPI